MVKEVPACAGSVSGGSSAGAGKLADGKTFSLRLFADPAVNNAAIPSTGQELTDMTADAWDRVLRINLTGTFLSMTQEIQLRRARCRAGSAFGPSVLAADSKHG